MKNVRQFVETGGLMSYGADNIEPVRHAGGYVARILKGEEPGDLPAGRDSIFELVVNLKTTKALGLTVPPSLLATADAVVE
jgi:putative ABC transport system substrate-binding protein